MNTNTAKETRNPVTLKSVLGLIALLALALVLCAPHVKTPGAAAQAPAAIENSVSTAPAGVSVL